MAENNSDSVIGCVGAFVILIVVVGAVYLWMDSSEEEGTQKSTFLTKPIVVESPLEISDRRQQESVSEQFNAIASTLTNAIGFPKPTTYWHNDRVNTVGEWRLVHYVTPNITFNVRKTDPGDSVVSPFTAELYIPLRARVTWADNVSGLKDKDAVAFDQVFELRTQWAFQEEKWQLKDMELFHSRGEQAADDVIYNVVSVPGSTGSYRPTPIGTARRTMHFNGLDAYLSLPGLEAALLRVIRR